MEINDILNGQKTAQQFYQQLRATTIAKAGKEPLKIADLCRTGTRCAPKQILPSGLEVTYGGALCYWCIDALLAEYVRKVKPTPTDKEDIARVMATHYRHWSVLDLPTFVEMCTMSRIPTSKNGGFEYELIALDKGSIKGKLEAYDKMRPNPQVLQGGSPQVSKQREWDPNDEHTKYMLTHLFDGTPFLWQDTEACKKYWHADPDLSNPAEKAARDRAATAKDTCLLTVDNAFVHCPGI